MSNRGPETVSQLWVVPLPQPDLAKITEAQEDAHYKRTHIPKSRWKAGAAIIAISRLEDPRTALGRQINEFAQELSMLVQAG